MNKLETLVRLVLAKNKPIVTTVFLGCELHANEKGITDFSAAKHLNQFRGSIHDLGFAVWQLEHVYGLIESYRLPTSKHIHAKVIPIAESRVGKLCAKYENTLTDEFWDELNGALLLQTEPCCSEGSPVAPFYTAKHRWKRPAIESVAEIATKKGALLLQTEPCCSEGSPVAPYNNNSHTISKDYISQSLETKSINSMTGKKGSPVAPLEKEMLETQQRLTLVKQIWDSWNQFCENNKPYLTKTPMPISLKPAVIVNTPDEKQASYALFKTIYEWVDANQDDCVDLWASFMEVALNNTWVQGREGYKPSLANLFARYDKNGNLHPNGTMMERAINGHYSKWDKALKLKDDGSMTEQGKEELKASCKDFKTAFVVE